MISNSPSPSRALRQRVGEEHGFTMLTTLLVLVVTLILISALFLGINGGTKLGQHDLDGKRAYEAAQAGANAFLYQLNQNPNYWESCSNDSLAETQVPGTSPAEYYSYKVIPNSASVGCTTNAISSLIDPNTGSLRMEFTGYSGNPAVERTIVAQYRKLTPLDFAWYTVYEALDDTLSGDSACGVFYRAGRDADCNIYWITGDQVNGPMYTQDQFLVYPGDAPVFGRSPSDKIESLAPAPSNSDTNYVCSGDNCQGLQLNPACGCNAGTALPNAPFVPLPSDNSELLTDATNYGQVFTGTTSIDLNGTSATVKNCPTSTSCTTSTVNLTQYPLIYVANGSSCNPPAYNPDVGTSYSTSGCAGDVYVYGNYTTALTIAAANNIIIDGNITTTTSGNVPTGSAALGLVANQYIRVMHGCSNGTNSSNTGQGQVPATFSSLTIDAAILALKHSFMVDNYDCGAPLNTLTVYGAIAQNFRGAVGTVSGSGGNATGYLKNYNYDNRLAYLLPPYLFDISTGGWEVERETLCTVGGSNPATAC
jgi:hypothetical protein